MDDLIKQNFIVSHEETIRAAMLKIDHNCRGIVYVAKEDSLVGSVTDGDVRRYLISNKNDLDVNIMSIANKKVRFLMESEEFKVEDEMKKWRINSIPVVDEKRRIIYIVFKDGIKTKINESLNVPLVIMAGGKGTRLKPFTDILPKPLILMGDKTITEHIMDRFAEYGCDDVHMIVNYKKELIKAFFEETDRQVTFYNEEVFGGTGGGLRLLKGKMNKTFFMTNCDIIIEEDYGRILEYHKKNHNLVTMVCARKKITVPYGVVELDENGCLLGMEEKPSHTYITNTGLYVLEPEFIDCIPADEFVHITDVIDNCRRQQRRIGVYVVPEERWLDMGQTEEMEKMKRKLGVV